MEFLDRLLTCSDCGGEFVFTAGEQLFFFDKQFKNDPKRCKPCKAKRAGVPARPGSALAAVVSRPETRTECSACGIATTVPFKPTQGRPVLCRQCFQSRQLPAIAAAGKQRDRSRATARLNNATVELLAVASGVEHNNPPQAEMAALPARS
jgi:CxxC-x17-CxxC domain-containing protein